MLDQNKTPKNWEEVIVSFLNQKKDAEETKLLKDVLIKNLNTLYNKVDYFDDEEIATLFDPKKNKKESTQSALEFQKEKFETIKLLQNKPAELDISAVQLQYDEKYEALSKKYAPKNWLTWASDKAGSISLATHVAKLTHSKIDSPSFFDTIDNQKKEYLTTSSLTEKLVDGAVSGNQFAPIFQFLELELNGDKLAPVFSENNSPVLEPFCDDKKELELWNIGFRNALFSNKISSHFLAKQVYFPLNIQVAETHNADYHLLAHLKSSSFAHVIYEKIYDPTQKHPRKLKSGNQYSDTITASFPRQAYLGVTASNHSNASQLNGKRGGKLFLFSAQPPTWQSQLKPPIYKKSFFYAGFETENTWNTISYLRDYLLRFESNDLSINDPERLKWIEKWVSSLVDDVLFYASSIQQLPSGWTDQNGIQLAPEHQYFLDPYRSDNAFQNARQSNDWQAVICNDFAKWLNWRLAGKDKLFTPQPEHSRKWRKQLETPLREYNDIIKIEIKQRLGAS